MTFSVLGIDTQTGQRVELPKSSRLQGLYIIGIQGTGKSGLIENLIIQDIKQDIGVCLLDPHGDLTQAVLARLPDRREQDVILLDLTEYRYPFGINLFTCSDPSNPVIVSEAASKVMHVFKKLWGKGGIVVEDAWGVLLEEILWNATLTFLEASKDTVYTMAEIPLLLADRAFRNRVVNLLTNRHVKNYWLNKYNPLSEKDQREETRSTLNRVNTFLTQPIVEYIVGQAHTTIDFRSIMDQGKILLIKLSTRHEAVTALIGSMVIAELLNAAFSRADLPVNKRKQFHIYADEFQNFATEDFATLLEQARKYGIGLSLAHQNRGQLDTNLKDRTRSVANHVIFKVNSKDADDLAGEFDYTPVRTKKIQKPRLEPVYKEWDEPVWTDAKAQWEYENQDELLETLLQTKREQLATMVTLENCFYLAFFMKYFDILHPTFNFGIGGNDENYHSRLNPYSHSAWVVGIEQWQKSLRGGCTREGLVVVREADFTWRMAHEPPLCEGYRFKKEIAATFKSQAQISLEECYADLLNGTDDQAHLLVKGSTHEVYETARYVNRQAAAQAVLELIESMQQVVNPLYTDAIFWFEPSGCRTRGVCTCKTDPGRCPYNRPCPCPACQALQKSVPRVGGERAGADWPRRGSWHYTAFSEAVAWVKQFAKQEYEKRQRLSQEIEDTKEAHRKYIDQLYKMHHTFVHRKEYQGLLPPDVMPKELEETDQENVRPTGARYVHYDGEQPIAGRALARWHDLVEELDQTPAERRDEIANGLSNLSMFTARVKIAIEERQVEYTIRTLEPERGLRGSALDERLARIRKQNIRDGYIRAKQEVETEIQLRQEYSEPPEEPPISRRQSR